MLSFFRKLFGSETNKEIDEIIKSDAFLVDVRSPDEFARGSVPGSVNVPLNLIQSQLEIFENKNNIVLFCQSGLRSRQATQILQNSGIKNVYNGGGWRHIKAVLKSKD